LELTVISDINCHLEAFISPFLELTGVNLALFNGELDHKIRSGGGEPVPVSVVKRL